MTTSLYDLSVGSYLQGLSGVVGFLAKGHEYCDQRGIELQTVVDISLRPDMLPFAFQLWSVRHHSLGAIEGLKAGSFSPPPKLPELDYVGWQKLIEQTRSELEAVTPDSINELAGKRVVFNLGEKRIPFSTENFALSFSLPNFYFHATTAYDILRIEGVPLGKRDFTGWLRIET